MVGDMDNTGSLNAQIIHQLATAVRSKIAIQVCLLMEGTILQRCIIYHPWIMLFFNSLHVSQTQQHKFVNWQCDFEYRGVDFTTAVTLGNPDVVIGSGISFLFWWHVQLVILQVINYETLRLLRRPVLTSHCKYFDQAFWWPTISSLLPQRWLWGESLCTTGDQERKEQSPHFWGDILVKAACLCSHLCC